MTFNNLTYSGFKRTGAMLKGTVAGSKSAYALKRNGTNTALNVINDT